LGDNNSPVIELAPLALAARRERGSGSAGLRSGAQMIVTRRRSPVAAWHAWRRPTRCGSPR